VTHYLADLVAPLDALLLKGDADPTTRAIMTCALVLSEEPDMDRLIDAFDRATREVPRMRQRVAGPSWIRSQAEWVPDDKFAVADHLRRVGAPGDRSMAAVLEMAGESATAPFDPARPLWDATLVTGVQDARAVMLLRVHHAIADGVRAIHMMANLLDLEPNPSKVELPVLEQRGSGLAAVRDGLVRTTSQAMLTQQRRADFIARQTFDLAWRPVGAVSRVAVYTRSAVRTYADGGAKPSPILRERSRTRKFATLEFALDDARAAAKGASATVNDLFLAGLLGGMRRYHEALGAPVADLPISFPVDVAGNAAPDSGNHFSAAVIPGPCTIADPGERLRAVHKLVVSRRYEPGLDAPLRLAPILRQMPSSLAKAALSAYARRVDLQASNIVGPDCALFLAGANIERFYAFGPLPGVPAMAVLVSHQGVCTVGFTIDPAAVTDPGLLIASTRESFAELIDS